MASRSAAAASEPLVAQAARDALSRGNAVDAVVAGVLAAVAEHASVLLGPLQVLVGGAGAGLCAVDGRVRQPGSGVPRPRGVLSGDPVPETARVGVPAMPAGLALVLAALGSLSLRRVAGAAIEHARARSDERARMLEVFARRGAEVMIDDEIAVEMTAVAGRSAGGSLTRLDLGSVRPVIVPCDELSLGATRVLTVPWRGAGPIDASCTQVVAAADVRGLVAVACYEAALEGLAVPALGLVAPACAAPVLRGEPRVRPGSPRPAPAPIALRAGRGAVDLAIGIAEASDAESSLETVVAAITEAAGHAHGTDGVSELAGPALAAALARASSGRPVAVVWLRNEPRVVVSF